MADGKVKTLIVVPARYGSSRFPGKPLAQIAGKSMVSRVGARAQEAAKALGDAVSVIATDDERILRHCADEGLASVMTEPSLASGSDRALAAADALGLAPDIIVNLQGDAPGTPVEHIVAVVRALDAGKAEVATPYIRLSWAELDVWRAQKQETPFSGTSVLVGVGGRALWFSKSILPLIRDEASRRAEGTPDRPSPVCRHIGLYAYRRAALRRFVSLAPSPYERLEGLEQLRLLEDGMAIEAVEVGAPPLSVSGIDTPQDLARFEALIAQRGGTAAL